jgi:hypothetical protein
MVSFIGGGNQSTRRNHLPVASPLQHNFISSTPRMSGVRTHNVSSDKHWLRR